MNSPLPANAGWVLSVLIIHTFMKLFGYRNRSIELRKAPQEETGKYEVFELALVDKEFEAVGSVGIAFRSDEVKESVQQEKAPEPIKATKAPVAETTE